MNNISKVEMQNTMWLGELTKYDHSYCQLDPLAELVEGKWIGIDAPKTRFPTRGKIRVNKSDLGKNRPSVGSLWVFGCVASSIKIDQWCADFPIRAQPVIDLSNISLAEARHRLFDLGIQLPDHQSRTVTVLLKKDAYCTLHFEPRDSLWVARTSERLIEIRQAQPSWLQSLHVKGSLFLPMREKPEGEVVRLLDWSTNGEFLAKVVARYRSAVTSYFALMEKSNETPVHKLERALTEGKFGVNADAIEALVDRLRAEWPETSRSLQAVETMSELLLQSDPGKRLLDDVVNRRKQALEAEIEKRLQIDIEYRLLPLQAELGDICKTIDAKKNKLIEVQHSLEKLKHEKDMLDTESRKVNADLEAVRMCLQTVSDDLAESLEKRAEAVAGLVDAEKREAALLAGISDIKALIVDFAERTRREMEMTGAHGESALGAFAKRLEELFHNAGNPVAPLLPSVTPPWWSKPVAALCCISSAELPVRLTEEAEAHGILTQDLVWIDGFVRAGEIVLLLGDHAEFALSAYARAVSSGEVRSHALDPSAIGLDDLWRVPSTGRPTAFALAWHQARVSPEKTVLLCLRDLDAAPFRLWLSSLHAILQSPDRPRNLLIFATAVAPLGGEEEFLGAEQLRHYLVALKPGSCPRSGQADIVFDKSMPDVTRLVNSDWSGPELSGSTLFALSKRGNEARVVRRAIRLCLVMSENDSTQSEVFGLAWAGYLLDSRTDGLPPALSTGHDQLKMLHVQR